MPFLLDSNVVIALMGGHPQVLDRVERTPPADLLLSSIVVYELMFGAFNSDRVSINLERLRALQFPTVEFDEGDAREAGRIRAALRRAGKPIGPYDVLIAGQALARNLTLVTNNVREFARVERLLLEDWTAM